MFSILFTNPKICTLIYFLFIGFTYLFYIYMPELCNMYIIFNIFNIYMSSILLVVFISLFVYINSMDNYFENKHPILYIFINIICTIVIFSCIGSILLSLYSILRETS